MMMFLLGFACCWFMISIILVITNSGVSPIYSYIFVTFPIWIIASPVILIIKIIELIQFIRRN